MGAKALLYQFQALDRDNRVQSGFEDADSEATLGRRLSERGMTLLDATVVGDRARPLRYQRVPPKHLIAFTHQFVALFTAGVPLLGAFEDLARASESTALRAVLGEVTELVRGGCSLSRAFRQFPGAFPETYVSMVEAGEASGKLDVILTRVAEYQEWLEETKGQVKTAMIYPGLLLAAIGGLMVILLTFLIPRLRTIYDGANVELPLSTRIVLATSDWVIANWMLLVLGVVLTVLAYVAVASTRGGRHAIDSTLLLVPVLGDVLRKISAARFSATLGNLLRSGVNVTRALEIVAQVVGLAPLAEAVHTARDRVRRGESLADSLEKTSVFQHLVISMLRAGERTGSMDETLLMVNRFYDREIPRTVKRLITLLEPTIIVMAGGVVAFIVGAALLPIFELAKALR